LEPDLHYRNPDPDLSNRLKSQDLRKQQRKPNNPNLHHPNLTHNHHLPKILNPDQR
jgi:hypothetical protein